MSVTSAPPTARDRMATKAARKRKSKNRVGLSCVEEERIAKPRKPKLTQAAQLAIVTGPNAHKLFKAHDRDEIKRRLAREEKNLRRDVPSEPWFDAKWREGLQFPPGGDSTLMHRCTDCDHYYPPNYISAKGFCQDCLYERMSSFMIENIPSSHSTVNLGKLKASRKKNGEAYNGGV